MPRSRRNAIISSTLDSPSRASRRASASPKCRMASPCPWSTVSDEHAGVAAAGPVSGDLLLQDDDVGVGIELLEEERGPEAGESGADHDDVGVPVTFEGE